MRDIIFRGKAIGETQKWIYGDLHTIESPLVSIAIIPESIKDIGFCAYVDPDTVSQFTGLCDDKGNKIFEGDIVKFIIKFRYTNIEREQIGVVEFNEGGFNPVRRAYDRGVTLLDYEVIGNKWDNPELLENKAVMFGDTLVDPKLSENKQ